jgi:putative glycosyltransferase
VEKGLRQNASTYTASRLIALFIEALTSFTSYPLRLIFVSGVCLACLSLFAGVGLILWKLLDPTAISLGWPSLMLSVWFLGGVTIAFIGVIGIYLSKVFNEAKGRPLFVVRDVHRYGDPTDPGAS